MSDRRGNLQVLQIDNLSNGMTAQLALGMVCLVGLFQLEGAWLPYLILPIFFLSGAVRPAYPLMGSNRAKIPSSWVLSRGPATSWLRLSPSSPTSGAGRFLSTAQIA